MENQIRSETLNNDTLDNMNEGRTIKYLGFHQNNKIDHTEIKIHLKNEFKTSRKKTEF